MKHHGERRVSREIFINIFFDLTLLWEICC